MRSTLPQVYLQWHKPAASLFCTAVLSRWQFHFAKSNVALPWCWANADLNEEQTSTGVFAVAQACCQPVLHSSTEQGAIAFFRNVQLTHVLSLLNVSNTAEVHGMLTCCMTGRRMLTGTAAMSAVAGQT